MSEPQNPFPHKPPYKTLGKCLKSMRQKFQESLGETSGAVEIDVEQLDRFERGAEVPSEDILMLLISHFNLQDDEAVELWELAGYDSDSGFVAAHSGQSQNRDDRSASAESALKPGMPVMLLALDSRILYANGVDLMADDNGIVLNFLQTADVQSQKIPVSRIGMSFEQAEQLVLIIQRAMLHKKYLSGPKQLPPPQQ